MKGSIRQRGATYTALWSTTDPGSGRRLQHSRGGFVRKGDAQKFLNSVLPRVDDGSFRRDTRMTTAELLNEWLAAKKSEELRPATISLYRMAVEAWICPEVGALEARQLSSARVIELSDKLRANGSRLGRGPLSARSVQITVQVLKASTRWAFETGLLGRDPLAGHKRPRARSKTMEYWTPAESRQFLETVKDDRMAAIWALFLARGPRRGEVAALKWSDIDFDKGTIRVSRARVLVDGQVEDSTPKTERGERVLEIDRLLVSLLRKHRTLQEWDARVAQGAYQDDGWLVCDALGAPWYPDTISERWDALVKASGLRRIRLHDTRHSAATAMLTAGTPVHVVAAILGHDPAETLRTYAKVIPGSGGQAGAALSAALLG
jgi:integrase